MKTIKLFCKTVMIIAFTVMMNWACSKVEPMVEQEEVRKVFTADLVFNGSLESFDATTRATSTSWQDGSMVYLQFLVGEEYVQGAAFYDAGKDKWNLEFYEEISEGQELNCQAYYFENAVEITYDGVSLDETSAVYRDDDGTYFYDGTTLTVNAHLVPVTGRVRFEGEPGASYNFFGPSICTYYDLAANKLSTTTKEFVHSLPESGKSDYYHAFFSEYSPHELYFYDKENNARYSRKFRDAVLAPGKSGYMNIPTIDNHNGWGLSHLVRTYTVGGVSFNMVLVDKGTFAMGYSKNPNYEVTPVHNVTLTKDYYMGETEVTQDLWSAVMSVTGGNDSDDEEEVNENFPKTVFYRSDIVDFIDRLNRVIDHSSFMLPTEAQWEFAAKGGNHSKGYVYSGSDVIDDVAWYYEDADSDICEVKQKLPNELGLYDMSGNVWEFTSDYYASYSNQDAVDPTGPASGSYHVLRGGGYRKGAICTCTYRRNYQHSPAGVDYSIGFRLASY